ncbi:MAG: hypothetical protein ACRDOJ_11965 [Nocardioidaceae bacterium]
MPRRWMFLVALTRYELQKDREHGGHDPIPPEDPGTVHAVGLVPHLAKGTKEPQILRYDREATCGAYVKLLLPLEFDPG